MKLTDLQDTCEGNGGMCAHSFPGLPAPPFEAACIPSATVQRRPCPWKGSEHIFTRTCDSRMCDRSEWPERRTVNALLAYGSRCEGGHSRMNSTASGQSWRTGSTPPPGGAWSDACTLEDLAVLDTGFTDYVQALDLDEKWPVRWTTTWKFSQTPITSPVRDLDKVDLPRSVPVRRFTWRTDQFHRPGLEYLMATDRHHGFESHEEERLLLVADFAAAWWRPCVSRSGCGSSPRARRSGIPRTSCW